MLLNHHSSRVRRGRPGRNRPGYTLVELLVAAAVSIMIMVILTGAFQAGLDTFRKMRAQGNMNERMRMARQALCDDLASPHFRAAGGVYGSTSDYGTDAHDHVSGIDFTQVDAFHARPSNSPPSDGFFRIWQGPDIDFWGLTPPGNWATNPATLPCVAEGVDTFGNVFTRAKTHALHMTVRRGGAGPNHMFRTQETGRQIIDSNTGNVWMPPPALVFPTNFIDPIDYRDLTGAFTSQWAEVTWFLQLNGSNANGLPLFNLYRRQQLVIPSNPSTLTGPPTGNLGLPPNNAQVLVGNGMAIRVGDMVVILPSPATYNPEMSLRAQFAAPTGNNFNLFYNHSGWPLTALPNPPDNTPCITQPRFRSAMMHAHDLAPAGGLLTSPDLQNLAGIPSQLATVMSFLPPPPNPFQQPYPTILQDIDTYAPAAAQQLHTQYDMNDLVLTDVVSFEIKALWDYVDPALAPKQQYQIPTSATTSVAVTNADYPYDFLPLSPNNMVLNGSLIPGFSARVFDTWSQHGPYGMTQPQLPVPNAPPALPNWRRYGVAALQPGEPPVNTATQLPLRIRVRAILIRVRIYDAKAEQTRQITIYQDV
jgi:hypothetical protein